MQIPPHVGGIMWYNRSGARVFYGVSPYKDKGKLPNLMVYPV
jgi:hypothetical protein